jgi:hypothetical protein
VKAFHAVAFLRDFLVLVAGAQAAALGAQAPPSAAQQFSVKNSSKRFIAPKFAA